MSDFAPPSGPPPPKGIPDGWKAQWNEQYSEWFYVNIYTKKSQWDKPTEPVYPPDNGDGAPPGAPPGYDHKTAQSVGPEKGGAFGSNNPYAASGAGHAPDISEDEKLARQLQAEEDARQNQGGAGSRGASDSYYGGQDQQSNQGYGSGSSPYPPQSQELPPRPQERGSGSKGFLGKLLGKGKQSQQPQYGQQPYGQPQGYGGGYPQQGYGPPPGAYGGGYPPQGQYGGGGYGGYPPQQQQFQQGRRPGGGGMGAMGGAALGAGAGLVGGMLLMDAIDDHEDHEQQEAYQDGYQDGQDNDYGGGGDDFGGGDF